MKLDKDKFYIKVIDFGIVVGNFGGGRRHSKSNESATIPDDTCHISNVGKQLQRA